MGNQNADIMPLDSAPEARHQDCDDIRVRIAPDQRGQAFVVVDVDPTTGALKDGSRLLQE